MSRETITVHSDGTNPVKSVSRSLQGHLDADDHRIVEVEVSLTIEPVADPDADSDETNADPPATGGRAPDASLNSPGRISQGTGRHEMLAALRAVNATTRDDAITAAELYKTIVESADAGSLDSAASSVSSALSHISRNKRLADRAKRSDSTPGFAYEYWLNDDGLAELERLDNSVFEFDVDL